MKIDKIKLFKTAWNIKNENKKYIFGECLKMAWALAKEEKEEIKKVYIKDWFVPRIELGYGKSFSNIWPHTIVKETEKAYLLEIEWFTLDGEYDGFCNKWVPKSCTLTPEEQTEIEEKIENAYNKGVEKYNKMIDFCKENSIKGVRVGLRKETILKKIQAAGLTYNY